MNTPMTKSTKPAWKVEEYEHWYSKPSGDEGCVTYLVATNGSVSFSSVNYIEEELEKLCAILNEHWEETI